MGDEIRRRLYLASHSHVTSKGLDPVFDFHRVSVLAIRDICSFHYVVLFFLVLFEPFKDETCPF
jgi:hypothetical protein